MSEHGPREAVIVYLSFEEAEMRSLNGASRGQSDRSWEWRSAESGLQAPSPLSTSLSTKPNKCTGELPLVSNLIDPTRG